MEIVAFIVLIVFSLIGFGAIFFTTFGTLIIFIGSFLYAIMTGFSVLTAKTIIILFMLYLFGEASEYLLLIVGAKKFGASNLAIIGAFIGGILGAIAGVGFLGIGLAFGALLGIFLGAFTVEFTLKRDFLRSLKAGAGSLAGRISSILVKIMVAIVMFSIIIYRLVSS